jgi:hypothetical protein
MIRDFLPIPHPGSATLLYTVPVHTTNGTTVHKNKIFGSANFLNYFWSSIKVKLCTIRDM